MLAAPVPVRFETHRIEEAVDDGLADHVIDEVAESIAAVEVDRLEADLLRMRKPVEIGFAGHHDGGPDRQSPRLNSRPL